MKCPVPHCNRRCSQFIDCNGTTYRCPIHGDVSLRPSPQVHHTPTGQTGRLLGRLFREQLERVLANE